MKNKKLKILMISDGGVLLFEMGLMLLIVLGSSFFISEELEMLCFFDIMIGAGVLYNGGSSHSVEQYGRYQTLGFCRKRFFQEQVILAAGKAVLLGLFRTVYQTICYDKYVAFFIEDTTNTADMYHRIPVVELFFSNFLWFTICYLVILIMSTLRIHPINGRVKCVGESLQLSYRIKLLKENHPVGWKVQMVLCKLFGLILIIVFSVLGLIGRYELELRSGFLVRLAIMAVMLVGCVIFYWIGKKRFQPKYV